LDLPGDGEGGRGQLPQRAADLCGAWPQAAPGAHLHAVERSEVAAKVQDVVGLYVDPSERASVLSVD
jgi:hypothetical protein